MSGAALELKGVGFTYPQGGGGVHDLDLALAPGELMAVIGPSGSGKTTLLKLVAGFLHPAAGRVLIAGREVTALSPRRRELGVVFQSYALFPHLRVWENVAYPLRVRGVGLAERRERARATLAGLGLKGFEERRVTTLSGGQQQRVALARALVFEPRALLLDEPLSALDAALRVEMRDEIRRLQRERGIATLHITHDQEEALSLADRVAVMRAGRLLQVAPPQEIYDRPASREVAGFVGQANLWEGEAVAPDRVRLSFAELVTLPHGRPPGERVVVLLRPEAVIPRQEAPGGGDHEGPDNWFPCQVTRDRFLGSLRRFDALVAGAVILGETSRRGEIRSLVLPPEALHLLPDSDRKGA